MTMSLRGQGSTARSNLLVTGACFVVSLLAMTCILLCDALEAWLQSAEEERGLVESVLAEGGGQYGE
jgi:hypothetical protein